MLYLPITRRWLFSMSARRIYLASALLALAYLATLVGVDAAMTASGISVLTPPAASLVRTLLYPEILGTALLWIAMWYFWLGFDRSNHLKRAIWFFVLFLFAPFGSALYSFVVYRGSVSVRAEGQSTKALNNFYNLRVILGDT